MADQRIEQPTNRRNLLRLSGAGALGALVLNGMTPQKALAQPQEFNIPYASWIHGHSMEIEYPDRMASAIRRGYAYQVEGKPGTTNWFHFAIPTPVIINDVRLQVDSIMLRMTTGSIDSFVRDVHIYDGERRIAVHNEVYLAEDNWFVRFPVPETPYLLWGLAISLGVGFGVEMMSHTMDFISVGADLVIRPPEPEPQP
ncbi:MAG: DUF6623 family protein [Planctomycetota bacterium]|jgi:hypothetical protein